MRFPNVLVHIHHGSKRHSDRQVIVFSVGGNETMDNDVALKGGDGEKFLSLATMNTGLPFLASLFKRFTTSIVKGHSASV